MKKYIIDRIEGAFAVCEEVENDEVIKTVDFQLELFENGAKEGEIFKLVKGKPVFLKKEQKKLEKEIDDLFDELKG